jgi:hypothetical protein
VIKVRSIPARSDEKAEAEATGGGPVVSASGLGGQ